MAKLLSASEKIQRKIYIRNGIILAIVVILTAALTSYPIYAELKQAQKKQLILSRDASTTIANEYFATMRLTANEVAKRDNIRSLFQNNMAKIDIQRELSTILKNTRSSHNKIEGLLLRDNQGEILGSSGDLINAITLPSPSDLDKTRLRGPFAINSHHYLLAITPIGDNNTPPGELIVLFNLDDLYTNLEQTSPLPSSGIALANLYNGKLRLSTPDSTSVVALEHHDPLTASLVSAIKDNDPGAIVDFIDKTQFIIAYSPLDENAWSLAISIPKNALYHSTNYFSIIATSTLAILLLSLISLKFMLRSLSQKLLEHTLELKKEIQKSEQNVTTASKKLNHLAYHDPLTELLNRRGFQHYLDQEISKANKQNSSFILTFIDFNKFKSINDSLGHDAGDHLLKEFTKRLCACLRKEDIIARLGGDEFAVISPNLSAVNKEALKRKIHGLTSQAISYDNKPLVFGISLGLVIYPTEAKSSNELCRLADSRMYQEKHSLKKIQT